MIVHSGLACFNDVGMIGKPEIVIGAKIENFSTFNRGNIHTLWGGDGSFSFIKSFRFDLGKNIDVMFFYLSITT